MSSLRLTHQLQQKMVLTPQLRQRIEMLQMTSLELAELIEQEMVTNPILEEVQPGDEVQEISDNILDQNSDGHDAEYQAGNDPGSDAVQDAGAEFNEIEAFTPEMPTENGFDETTAAEIADDIDGAGESSDAFDEIDYGREFQDYLDPGYRTQEIEYKDDAPSFEQFLTHSPNLSEHLEWQLNLLSLSEDLDYAASLIIGNLDEDGRLTAELDEIADMAGCTLELVEEARQHVLQLDPVGCGARDVKECLLAQLRARGEGDGLSARLVQNHLEDLQPHRLQHLAKNTGVEIHKLDDEIKRIRTLDPYPGRRYSSEDPIYVAPEVYIEMVDDEFLVYFADDGSPRLRISPTYHKLAEQSDTTKETKDFIKEKVRSAVDLLRNIEHRRQTIYRVVECIVDRQRDFLERGVEYIKPMMLKDIAEDIGMHLSTISRVVNRKYAHTPQGVIELRRFFSEGMMNEEGEEVSTRILKLRIKKMIEEEDSKKPLTDDEIAKVLSKEGVKLSRRTVAKYRDQMQIAGSRERKTII
ncbi:MAG: RNA polymerase factor sigma-54 [Pyrinomonadaceae bacterium]|nr:RNA polymerase factor sigma-54 [Pyrinomonadaceae bacterium]MBP6212485.1 RNA polymerase factor sigma-54 [Pyrinomonadaceae bacterium]